MIPLGGLCAGLLFHLVIMPVFVRRGQETVVPDVRGLPLSEVARVLAGAVLAEGSITPIVDEHVAAGRVFRQNPPPEFRVKKGREVNLVISLGPAALRVPQLERESLVHARFLLAREGMAVGHIRTVSSQTVPRDQVVAANPAPGSRLSGRSTVDLLVSAGPHRQRFLMPDLRGWDAGTAERLLEQSGIQVRRKLWPGSRSGMNRVVEQTPPRGYPIEEGGTVEILTGG